MDLSGRETATIVPRVATNYNQIVILLIEDEERVED